MNARVVVCMLFLAGCGAQAPVDESAEAYCAGGGYPGCGACIPNPTSPKGGYQTCSTCDGETVTRACTYRSRVPATFTGTLEWWGGDLTVQHYSQPISLPVTFLLNPPNQPYWTHGWNIYVPPFSANFGSVQVQLGSGAGGVFDEPSSTEAFLSTMPFHVVGPIGTIDLNIPLDTEFPSQLPWGEWISGSRLDANDNITVTGSNEVVMNGLGWRMWVRLSGHFSAVP
jgi:hypothetical protein